MNLAELLFTLLGILGTLLWCALCVTVCAAGAGYLVGDAAFGPAVVMVAALAGLAFALWSTAKVARIKRL